MSAMLNPQVCFSTSIDSKEIFDLWRKQNECDRIYVRKRSTQRRLRYRLRGVVVFNRLQFLCLERGVPGGESFRVIAKMELTRPESLKRREMREIVSSAKQQIYQLLQARAL